MFPRGWVLMPAKRENSREFRKFQAQTAFPRSPWRHTTVSLDVVRLHRRRDRRLHSGSSAGLKVTGPVLRRFPTAARDLVRRVTLALISSETRSNTATARATRWNTSIHRSIGRSGGGRLSSCRKRLRSTSRPRLALRDLAGGIPSIFGISSPPVLRDGYAFLSARCAIPRAHCLGHRDPLPWLASGHHAVAAPYSPCRTGPNSRRTRSDRPANTWPPSAAHPPWHSPQFGTHSSPPRPDSCGPPLGDPTATRAKSGRDRCCSSQFKPPIRNPAHARHALYLHPPRLHRTAVPATIPYPTFYRWP